MKNFYYVLSVNLTNPDSSRFLEKSNIVAASDSVIDFKIRSKLFLSVNETTDHISLDFKKKMPMFFGEEEKLVKLVQVLNPAYAPASGIDSILEKYRSVHDWDDDCVGTFFFLSYDEENSEATGLNDWILKYEIFVSEDSIELSRNGDFALSKSIPFSSAYH